ncbi:PEP-CTERM sorting domain-containing protein [Marinobacter halotolerans]|uniref:PEP-CTERM sorting domain-containing protein n=1 Tax=Marinobacter halotolerans TaxID=1569211 RepID=UPI00177B0E16|nr:PEP-CTERM sorting domain-containing protein [Marinobacter halotolerans]
MRNVLFLSFLLVSFSSVVNAEVIGLDIEANGSLLNPASQATQSDYTLGWEFSLGEDVVLTALGLWDQGADGLNMPQTVSLWRVNGDLLASAQVYDSAIAVASASEQGQWLFTDVTDIFLSAGNYVIGADRLEDSLDAVQKGSTGISTDPRLAWIEARYAGLDKFGFPGETASGSQYFGPNLMLRSVSVPEPGTLGILGVSLAGLWMARRRETK